MFFARSRSQIRCVSSGNLVIFLLIICCGGNIIVIQWIVCCSGNFMIVYMIVYCSWDFIIIHMFVYSGGDIVIIQWIYCSCYLRRWQERHVVVVVVVVAFVVFVVDVVVVVFGCFVRSTCCFARMIDIERAIDRDECGRRVRMTTSSKFISIFVPFYIWHDTHTALLPSIVHGDLIIYT